MNKYIKYGAWSAGATIAIVMAGIIYITATFDPNDYKTRIIRLVQDKQQRTLGLDGDISLAFFPGIGININKVSLSEFQSDQQFMYLEKVHISLALLPLLSKRFIVDEISVEGLKATLIKFKNGKTNIGDLLTLGKSSEKKSPLEFDIASIHMKETELIYLDEATNGRYLIKGLNLNTKRIANKIPGEIDLSAVIQGIQPKLDLATQIKAAFTFDLHKQLFQIEGIKLQATGNAFEISNLTVLASGSARANFEKQEFSTKNLVFTVTGMHGENHFNAKLDVPALNLIQNNFTSDKLALITQLDSSFGNIHSSLVMLNMAGNPQSFRSDTLTLALDIKQPEQTFHIKLGSPATGKIEQQQLSLPNLTLTMDADNGKFADKPISSEMNGNMQINGRQQNIQVNLVGRLLQSKGKAIVTANGFQDPAIRFNIDIDQFDMDSYLPRNSDRKLPVPAEQPFDLASMKNINLGGQLHIGTLKIANVKFSQAHLDVKTHNDLITIHPLHSGLK